NITQELLQAGIELLATKLPKNHLPVRLLGFGVNGFDDTGRSQRQLFDEPDRERHRQLDRVADQISERFGKLAIRRGGGADQNGCTPPRSALDGKSGCLTDSQGLPFFASHCEVKSGDGEGFDTTAKTQEK